MTLARLFNPVIEEGHDRWCLRYRCEVCGREIGRRPKGARIAHAQMHVRKKEAHAVYNNHSHDDEYFVGAERAKLR